MRRVCQGFAPSQPASQSSRSPGTPLAAARGAGAPLSAAGANRRYFLIGIAFTSIPNRISILIFALFRWSIITAAGWTVKSPRGWRSAVSSRLSARSASIELSGRLIARRCRRSRFQDDSHGESVSILPQAHQGLHGHRGGAVHVSVRVRQRHGRRRRRERRPATRRGHRGHLERRIAQRRRSWPSLVCSSG